MIKRALLVGLGFLSFCFPLAAQQTSGSEQTENETIMLEQSRRTGALDVASALALYRPEIFSTVDSLVLIQSLPVLALLDGQRLPVSSELGRMGLVPLDLFPAALLSVAPARAQKGNAALVHRTDVKNSGTDGKDSPGEMMNSSSNPIYYGGEVGVLYGRSIGKFGGDIMQTYILGDVGNDKFQISVGAAYEESSGRALRLRSFAAPR